MASRRCKAGSERFWSVNDKLSHLYCQSSKESGEGTAPEMFANLNLLKSNQEEAVTHPIIEEQGDEETPDEVEGDDKIQHHEALALLPGRCLQVLNSPEGRVPTARKGFSKAKAQNPTVA